MRSVMERAPVLPEKDPFGPDGIQRDIADFRKHSSWTELETMPSTNSKPTLLNYLKELGEQKEAMVMLAKEKRRSPDTLLQMKMLYDAELVRVWAMREETHYEDEFEPTFLKMVEWQHRVTGYLLDASEGGDLHNPKKREPIRQFWEAYREVFSSSVPEADRKRAVEEVAADNWRGILRPVALGYTLHKNLGLDIYLPEEEVEDTDLKVDLTAEKDGFTYLFQLKPLADPSQTVEIESLLESQNYEDPETEKYVKGFKQYIAKNELDPAKTVGALVRINWRNFDRVTGLPDEKLERDILQDFSVLDSQFDKS